MSGELRLPTKRVVSMYFAQGSKTCNFAQQALGLKAWLAAGAVIARDAEIILSAGCLAYYTPVILHAGGTPLALLHHPR